MGNETYKGSNIERKLQILGYAHNQGMGGAENSTMDWKKLLRENSNFSTEEVQI